MAKRASSNLLPIIFTFVFFYMIYRYRINNTTWNLISLLIFSAGYALTLMSYVKRFRKNKFVKNPFLDLSNLDEHLKETALMKDEDKDVDVADKDNKIDTKSNSRNRSIKNENLKNIGIQNKTDTVEYILEGQQELFIEEENAENQIK